MFQMLTFKDPIPSCEIHSMQWNANERSWSYIYAVKIPIEITDKNKMDLMVYEYIADLVVKSGENQHDDAVNIHFKTLTEYLTMLETQRKIDLLFRERWLSTHPDAKVADWSKRSLEHRDYEYDELS